MDIGAIWDLIALNPMINVMVWLSDKLFDSFGLTIIVLTVIVRGVMYPLTMRQLHASRAMQELSPKLKELQKKYAKDKQKLAQEQMKLYKESGVSTTGCLLPMLIQMPVWIALYQSIIRVLAVTPEDFLSLSNHLYDWPVLYSALPLDNSFLWMNLALPDFFLALLVGASMYVQQKMMTPQTTDPQQQAQGRLMLVMMPLMFMFFSITFPSGMALYWVASALISIVIQYFVTGWGSMAPTIDNFKAILTGGGGGRAKPKMTIEKKTAADISDAEKTNADITSEESATDERGGEKRPDSGRSNTARLRAPKRKTRGGKSRRHKRR